MRVEEIARIRPASDVKQTEPIEPWGPITYIELLKHENWQPKTDAGVRIVPIHPWLIEHGFIELVGRRIKEISAPKAR